MITNNPMKNSQITIQLYDRAPLTKERNGIIDNLNRLLNEYNTWQILTEYSNNPFELSMKQYKIQASDSNAFITTANIQYMRISWGGRYFAYYWVNKINRSSNDVITLDIELDFLNTLHNGDSSTTSPLLSFSPLSSIERQHENRFYNDSLIDDEGFVDVAQIVDNVKEGVQVSLLRQESTDTFVLPKSTSTDLNKIDMTNWYLVYATPKEPEGKDNVDIYLIPEYRPFSADRINVASGKRTPTIAEVDRLQSRIIKIVKCPYCPVEVTPQSNYYLFSYFSAVDDDNIFNIYYDPDDMRVLRYDHPYNPTRNSNDPLMKELTSSNYEGLILDNTKRLHTNNVGTLLNDARYIKDPKLDSSEFKGDYFVYDSFAIQIKPEEYSSSTSPSLVLKYVQSIDCDSSLLFKLDIDNYRDENFYTNLISSTRKNEIPMFSSDYINYLRNGYNYDRTKQIVSSVMNIAGSATSLGFSISTANPIGIAGSAISLSKSISGAVTGEIDFEKNLSMMKNKAMNVESVNDISLFTYYGKNRIKRVTMTMTPLEENRWNDIFHFFGYNRAGVLGTPNVTSRVWFNYLKGEILLANAEQIPVWLYEKVKSAYREGVTYFHCHQVMLFPSLYKWDLKQEKENYETFLLDL